MSLYLPLKCAGHVKESCVALDCFVVSGCDSPEAFDAVKEALDDVALRVELLIVAMVPSSKSGRRNDGFYFAHFELGEDFVGIVGAVRHACIGVNVIDKRFGHGAIVLLTGRQYEVNGFAGCVDERVDLAGQAAAGPSYGVFFGPSVPPDES